MPSLTCSLTVIVQESEDVCVAEALRFRALSGYGETPEEAVAVLERQASVAMRSLAVSQLASLALPTPAVLRQINLTIPPSDQNSGWNTPLNLEMAYIAWGYPDSRLVAYVPGLQIEVVIAASNDQSENEGWECWEEIIEDEIMQALQRTGALKSLEKLVRLQTLRVSHLEKLEIKLEPVSPAEILKRDYQGTGTKPDDILNETCHRLKPQRARSVFEVDEWIERLSNELNGQIPRSVLLTGKAGCGKSAIFGELAARPAHFGMKDCQFWETSGAKLVAGMSGFGEWQERCLDIIRVAKDRKIVFHPGNLGELLEVGKSVHNQQGIASFLRPFIDRGDIQVVVECTPEQLPLIEQADPMLVQAFSRLDIPEPERKTCLAIYSKVAERLAKTSHITVPTEVIREVDRLHRRYAPYSAIPGRPLRFIRHLLRAAPEASTILLADVSRAFSRESGLPEALLDDSIELDLDSVRYWFNERVIGQKTATDQIVDRIGWIKTELTRPGKPIASLLFIGPTGVGKTEMAKALATYLFGKAERMIRFDMSEYNDPLAVKRLVGGVHTAEGLLTSRVREQPFTIVLFDEVEKAHPDFFDLLLQVMGEGRLTDARGQIADFCSTVVIMTSNLGARNFQRGTMVFQENVESPDRATEHFTTEVQRFLRPELFNRIDRIIPFQSLEESVIQTICRRELNHALGRHGLHYSPTTLTVDDAVFTLLAEQGYDSRYGARPLRRIIEKLVLRPIADRMNHYRNQTDLSINLSVKSGQLEVLVSSNQQDGDHGEEDNKLILMRSAQTLRRNGRRLQSCLAYRNICNLLNMKQRAKSRKHRLFQREHRRRIKLGEPTQDHQPNWDVVLEQTIQKLSEICRQVDEFVQVSSSLEDTLLHSYYLAEDLPATLIKKELSQLTRKWQDTLMTVYAESEGAGDLIRIELYARDSEILIEQAEIYNALACNWNLQVRLLLIVKPIASDLADSETLEHFQNLLYEQPDETDSKTEAIGPQQAIPLSVSSVPALRQSLGERKLYAIVLQCKGPQASLLFMHEGCVHQEVSENDRKRWLVRTASESLPTYRIPLKIERGLTELGYPARRTYDLQRREMRDQQSGLTLAWKPDETVQVLQKILEQRLNQAARGILVR